MAIFNYLEMKSKLPRTSQICVLDSTPVSLI